MLPVDEPFTGACLPRLAGAVVFGWSPVESHKLFIFQIIEFNIHMAFANCFDSYNECKKEETL
jgi:hypothetical protein